MGLESEQFLSSCKRSKARRNRPKEPMAKIPLPLDSMLEAVDPPHPPPVTAGSGPMTRTTNQWMPVYENGSEPKMPNLQR
jgi:hypothetical protein